MRTIEEMKGDMPMEQFLLYCSSSLKFWGEKVIGYQIKPFHERWLNLMKTHKRVAIQAFTGSGKSEIPGICYVLWFLFHNHRKEVLILSKTLQQSISILERIRDTISENELLRSMIDPKNLKSERWSTRSTSGAEIRLSNGRKINCRPYSENIKGYHVDLVIGDEVASYPDHDIWFRFVVTRANAKKGTVLGISTPESPTDLMQELINNPEYVSDTFGILDEEGNPVWEERYDLEFVESKKREMGKARFEREYMCNPNAEVEGSIFNAEDIVECTDISLAYGSKSGGGTCFIGGDFAISDGPRADFDVYFVVEKFGGKIVLRDAFRGKGIPVREKALKLKEYYERYNADIVHIDVSNIGRTVAVELTNLGIPFLECKFTHPEKRELITNLVSVIQNKSLVIPYKRDENNKHEISKTLIEELLAFREEKTESTMQITYKTTAKHDDTVMALALACKCAVDIQDGMVFPQGI